MPLVAAPKSLTAMRRDHRALAAQVGIGARHVVHDADLDGAVGVLRLRPGAPEGDRERCETDEPFHWRFSVAKAWPRSKPPDSHGVFRKTEHARRGFMRLSRITRTAVSAGEMKPQLERQPEILR